MTDVISAPTSADAGPLPEAPSRTDSPQPLEPGPPQPSEGTWPGSNLRRLQPLARPCGYYALSRVAVFFAALMAKWMFPKIKVIHTMGSIWDGRWYLMIAQHGYPGRLFNEGDGSRWAFFPAWPAAIRGTAAVTGLSVADAAVLLAFVFGLTSVIAIWLAVRQIFGQGIADRTVLLYVFFPTAYVLSMGYTEGLFLTAAAGCIYCLSRRFWVSAALFAVVAGLTRNLGAVVIVCVLVAALPVAWRERKARPLIAAGLAPLGLVAFMAYGWARVGSPLAFMTAQRYWDGAHFISFEAPLYALRDLLTSGVHSVTHHASTVTAVLALLVAYFGMALFIRMRRSGITIPVYWWVFTVGAVLTAFSPFYPNSILRYTMAAFPLFVAFAWKIKPSWEGAVVGMLAMVEGAMMVVVMVGNVHPMVPFFP
jgi:hypothetical protein